MVNFNLSLESQSVDKTVMIPLCISDLVEQLLLSKVDQTVEKYLGKVHRCLQEETDFTEILEREMAETKAQIDQVGLI